MLEQSSLSWPLYTALPPSRSRHPQPSSCLQKSPFASRSRHTQLVINLSHMNKAIGPPWERPKFEVIDYILTPAVESAPVFAALDPGLRHPERGVGLRVQEDRLALRLLVRRQAPGTSTLCSLMLF